ncbi:MAG: hypothetical protein WDN09_04135 [bacterium]
MKKVMNKAPKAQSKTPIRESEQKPPSPETNGETFRELSLQNVMHRLLPNGYKFLQGEIRMVNKMLETITDPMLAESLNKKAIRMSQLMKRPIYEPAASDIPCRAGQRRASCPERQRNPKSISSTR